MSTCLIAAVSFGQGLFVDKTSELGLEISSSQIAFIDYNNDGWVDIYTSGTLWKNNQGKSFSKVFDKGSIAVNAFRRQVLIVSIVSDNRFEETYSLAVTEQVLAQTGTDGSFPAALFQRGYIQSDQATPPLRKI